MGEFYTWAATGKITELESWAEPEFEADTEVETGHTSAVRIASRMVERQSFVLIQPDGREVTVNLVNSGVELRNGHILTAVWAAPRGQRYGHCIYVENHTTGAKMRLTDNIKLVRPKIENWKIFKFGMLSIIPAAIVLMLWLLIPGSLDNMDMNLFLLGIAVALVILFIIGSVVSKLVLDYLRADDDVKIWQAVEMRVADARRALTQRSRSHA